MKILVFSDSHGKSGNIIEALKIHGGVCDFAVFLGDGLKDIDYVRNKFPTVPFVCVKGNCDVFSSSGERDECVLDLGGVRVLITHGHKYNVKYGYGTLLYRARELEVDAVLFGHTHLPIDTQEYVGEKRIHLFNPGSVGMGGTYGIINVSGSVLVSSHGKI